MSFFHEIWIQALITEGSQMPFWDFNITLFHFFNGLTSNPLIAKISPVLADGPIFFLPIFLISLWIYHTFKEKDIQKKINLMFLFYCAAIAHFISITIQIFVDIERPETAIVNSGKLLLEHIPDGSFPSDHASVSVAFLIGLCLLGYKKVFFTFLPWVIIMLLSRVIVGVHWPFDVIAGSIIGIISGYLGARYLPKIKFVNTLNLSIIRLLSYIKL